MRFLLVLLVVLLGVWLWRSNRESISKQGRQQRPSAPQPQTMVRCELCSMHVPATDAITGNKGMYCSADHLRQAEP
jgi:uncharacterized protein